MTPPNSEDQRPTWMRICDPSARNLLVLIATLFVTWLAFNVGRHRSLAGDDFVSALVWTVLAVGLFEASAWPVRQFTQYRARRHKTAPLPPGSSAAERHGLPANDELASLLQRLPQTEHALRRVLCALSDVPGQPFDQVTIRACDAAALATARINTLRVPVRLRDS